MFRNVVAAFSVVLIAAPALAASGPQSIGGSKDWSAWKYTQKSRKRCFVHSSPSKATPSKLDHGEVSFFVRSTLRKNVTEASLQVGYPLAPRSEVKAEVAGKRFTFATSGYGAWLARPEREAELLKAMMKGSKLTVVAWSKRGNRTEYLFSLAGLSDAMGRLRRVCP